MKPGTASGPDGIGIDMYKSCPELFTPFLTTLFNNFFNEGKFPESWCQALISPIHKKGSTHDPANYRRISLSDSISKIIVLY
ncbi:hypothetical protein SNE40_002892 [Patella caerulea]